MPTRPAAPARTPANRLALDYRAEARRLGPPPAPIIDVHSHINGAQAARIYHAARHLYGVTYTYSMTQIQQAEGVREALGDTIRFIAVPSYQDPDRRHAMREGFLENLDRFHALGSRIVKFWAAPRSVDFAEQAGDASLARLDNEWTLRVMERAYSMGFMFMTHVGDPDTWFATKYTDASRYGTKRDQYIPLERALDRFPAPWIAAHMGGWPEDLSFLDGMLARHPNLSLDTSATKWMVRELSRHPREALLAFVRKWNGRILFGSDIVTTDMHLSPETGPRGMGEGASSPEEAFDLYASRYWALRTLWETAYDGESPIVDPDLKMVDPARHDEWAAPRLVGKAFPKDVLRVLYHDAATGLVHKWHEDHP